MSDPASMRVTNKQVSAKLWEQIEQGYRIDRHIQLDDGWWIVYAIDRELGEDGMVFTASLIKVNDSY